MPFLFFRRRPPPSVGDRRVTVAVVTTHTAPARGFGGIAECVDRTIRQWAGKGYSFSLCTSDGSTAAPLRVADLDLPPSVPIHLYRVWPNRFWAHRLGFGPAGIAAVWSAINNAHLVHIHGLGTWPTLLAQAFCLILRRPMLLTPHAGLMDTLLHIIRTEKKVKWALYRLLVLPAVRRTRALQATSVLETRGLDRLAPGIPVTIIPNGMDLSVWSPLPPRSRSVDGPGSAEPATGLVLCYLGRLSREKGILRFLGIWKDTCHPGDKLILCGHSYGAYGAAVEAACREIGDAVALMGELDRPGVRDVLARSDMLVLPSGIDEDGRLENFGNVVAEALASARPVLVARGLPWDEVEEEGVGLVFDHDTDEDIADSIRRARALGPARLDAMGRAGRRMAEERFDMTRIAESQWHLVQSALPAQR